MQTVCIVINSVLSIVINIQNTTIFWDASRLFWFKGLLDNISIRFMRSFSSQTKYTGEFWKAYTKMVYRILNLFFIFKKKV